MRQTTNGYSAPNAGPYVKDGISNCIVDGKQDAVDPQKTGTKAAAHYQVDVGAGKTADPSAVK